MGAAERVQEVDAFGVARVQLAAMEKRLSSPELFDSNGALFFDGIPPGQCTLTLSDIDTKEFSPPVLLPGQAATSATGPIQQANAPASQAPSSANASPSFTGGPDTSSDDGDDTPSATTLEVASGDTLSSLAERASFLHFATLWSHPQNATLRASRELPHVLLAGDQVVVPLRTTRPRSVPTGTTTTLVVYPESLHAKVHVVDLSGNDVSLDGTTVSVDGDEVASAVLSGATVDVPLVARDARTITLALGDQSWDLHVGEMPPPLEDGGTEARLENLSFGLFGSDAGGDGADDADDDDDNDADERRSLALELFQDSVGRKPTGDDADGTLDDLRTKAGV